MKVPSALNFRQDGHDRQGLCDPRVQTRDSTAQIIENGSWALDLSHNLGRQPALAPSGEEKDFGLEESANTDWPAMTFCL